MDVVLARGLHQNHDCDGMGCQYLSAQGQIDPGCPKLPDRFSFDRELLMAMMTPATHQFVDMKLREAAEAIEKAQSATAAKKGREFRNGGADYLRVSHGNRAGNRKRRCNRAFKDSGSCASCLQFGGCGSFGASSNAVNQSHGRQIAQLTLVKGEKAKFATEEAG